MGASFRWAQQPPVNPQGYPKPCGSRKDNTNKRKSMTIEGQAVRGRNDKYVELVVLASGGAEVEEGLVEPLITDVTISIIIGKLCNYVIEYISVIERLPSLLALVSLRSPPTFRRAIGDFVGEHHLARLTVDHTPASDGYHTVIEVKAYISYIYGS
jgi:hypothetical protein